MRKAPITPLDVSTATTWAAKAHLYVLEALMSESRWTCRDVAFHGGTSLHFNWSSPRRSEDLDFLLAREVDDVAAVMKAVHRRVQERFLMDDPRILVEAKNRTGDDDRMPCYLYSVSSSERRGKVKVKVEFWRVDRDYLATYPTVFRTPLIPGDIVSSVMHPIPAARLATAFADKLTAFATRPYLKWRDVYDLWWIGTQTREPLDVKVVSEQFLHNVSAYETRDGLPPDEALRLFLRRSDAEIVAAAETDLKPWLPETLWRRYNPGTVAEMVAYCRESLTVVADHVATSAVPEDGEVLKRGPR